MKCQNFELKVRELTKRTNPLPADEELWEHARACSSCGKRLRAEQDLDLQLQKLADQFSEVNPSARLRETIRLQFQRETQPISVVPEEPGPERLPFGLALAATLLLILALAAIYVTSVPSPLLERETAQSVPSSSASQAGEETASPERMYSEFIPIGNCRSLECLDRAHMMRIDLPRSSVSYFGIPKTRIQSQGDRISADVLVGEDGIARAIRFVY